MSDTTYRRIGRRLIPFLFVCYIFNYLDRVNVGFAKLQMLDALGWSEAIYGLGAGIFFLGYVAFGVPSNIMIERIGPRRWLALIMVLRVSLSAALMFATTPMAFYLLRFLTGAAEAGFFPGIVLYLTRWFPSARHGRVMALFMSAIPLSGVIGGPLSGWMLAHFDAGQGGLAAWQWLFLLQGLPTVALGIALYYRLDDSVASAAWLAPAERAEVERDLAAGRAESHAMPHSPLGAVLADRAVWGLGLVYFSIQSGVYALNFWLPSIIKGSGVASALTVGWLSAIPYLAAAIFMILLARSADRRQERALHLAGPAVLGAAGLLLTALAGDSLPLAMIGLTLAAMGALTGLPMFWPFANLRLTGATAAIGLAFINSLGQFAGFLSPYLVGAVKDATGSTTPALLTLACAMAIGAAAVLVTRRRVSS